MSEPLREPPEHGEPDAMDYFKMPIGRRLREITGDSDDQQELWEQFSEENYGGE